MIHLGRARAIATFIFLSALAAGCSKRPSEGTATTAPAADSAPAGAEAALPTERKLIRRAELRVEVADYSDARTAIERRLEAYGGYVESADVQHASEGGLHAELVLRVTADKLAAFMKDATELGEVGHESIQTDDVTDQYVDLDARRRAAERLEARLLDLLEAGPSSVGDLLEVERELARVRGDIERMQGSLQHIDKQVAYSSVRLVIDVPAPVAAALPLGPEMTRAVVRSSALLVETGRGLLVLVAALLPWSFFLLGAGWVVRRWLRQRRLARLLK
jgi:hypothetical protein